MFKRFALKLHLQTSKKSSDIPYLLLITDAIRLPISEGIIKYLPKNIGIICRDHYKKNIFLKTKEIFNKCRSRKIKFFFAGSILQASLLRIPNIHIPENLLRMPTKAGLQLRRINKNLLITSSAHNYPAIIRASNLNISAILLSPVFPTYSNLKKSHLGVLQFSTLSRKSPTPILALGGVNKNNIKRLYSTNASGVAALDAFKKDMNE